MRPIPLARVCLQGTGQNICGVSAQKFVASKYAVRGSQTEGVVDHLTLLDNGVVLFEKEGRRDELVPLHALAVMSPTEDLSQELLGQDYIADRASKVAALKAEKDKAAAKRNEEIVARNTDAAAVVAKKSGPKPKA